MHFDPTAFFFSAFFGLIGYAAWRHARLRSSYRHAFLAIALMGFPYFVKELWQILAVGGVLVFFLFWPRY